MDKEFLVEMVGEHTWLFSVPWDTVLVTALLFLATLALTRLSKRFLIRRAEKAKEHKAETGGFWKNFWETENRFLKRSLSTLLWLAFVAASLSIWAVHIGNTFEKIEHLIPHIFRCIFIIIGFVALLKASRITIKVFVERGKAMTEDSARGTQRMQTLEHIFRYISTALITFVAVLMLLNNFGIDLAAILATVGVASLAIGFGAQSLVKDIVSGIFILVEDQFAVGDVVVVNGEGGFVERMTLRITQLRNTEGTLVTVPNGSIANVKNMTSEWSRVDYKIGVGYGTDLDRGMEVLMDEARKLAADMPDKIVGEPEAIGVDEFCESSITLRVWIKTRPLMQWAVRREYNRRIHRRFDKEGIEIPFPQHTLWLREPGEAKLLEALASRRG